MPCTVTLNMQEVPDEIDIKEILGFFLKIGDLKSLCVVVEFVNN